MLQKWHVFPVLLAIALAALSLAGPAVPTQAAPESEVSAANGPVKIYLPMIERKAGYTGKVTYRGAPAAGQTVTMLAGKDGNYTTWTSTTTDSNGFYAFLPENYPPLGGGNTFYVRWANTSKNDIYLSAWYCDVMTGSSGDDNTCDFDISNIQLVAPADFAKVNLPVTFQWERRVTTSDHYLVEFNTRSGSSFTWRYDSPNVGYNNKWTMTSLPSALTAGAQYWWGVVALGPNGYGESYFLRAVTIGTATSSSALAETQPADSLAGELPREPSDAPRQIEAGQE